MCIYIYSRASLVSHLVKNPPAMQETWVQSLGWEDPLEKGTVTHSSILAWKIPWTIIVCGVTKSRLRDLTLSLHFHCRYISANFSIRSTLSFPNCVHNSVLYVCVSILALKVGSSVSFFFWILHMLS